jgi:hypothetical protein
MVQMRSLARSISDVSFGMFRTLLEYKAKSVEQDAFGLWLDQSRDDPKHANLGVQRVPRRPRS